jgi:phosphohistidine phosphatase
VRVLLLLRHGKSDWDAGSGADDRQRPLASRGKKAARTIGRFLADAGQVPDLALTSPAVRAESTLRLAVAEGDWDCPTHVVDALYGGGVGSLVDVVRDTADDVHLLLVVGHEPTWSETASRLIGGGHLRFPTGALARLDLDVETWADVAPGCGELAWSVNPRLLDGRKGPG